MGRSPSQVSTKAPQVSVLTYQSSVKESVNKMMNGQRLRSCKHSSVSGKGRRIVCLGRNGWRDWPAGG